jgi:formate hydrogenlyase subunit 3/multisubunit Na+/H+ antiporter MnhD subunit
MSAPLLWIVIPFFIGVFLLFFQDRPRLVYFAAILLCLLLSLTALLQPIGGVLQIGSKAIEIKTTLTIFGRNFVLENKDRFFLLFIYSAAVFWFIGSVLADLPNKFIPMGLVILSLLTAALAVEPFLYSAVLVELAVIISLPLLVDRGKPIGKGVLHYFIFMSLAMPFILLSGWVLSGTQVDPSNVSQMRIGVLLLSLGFAFWLAVFPFHVWIPELAEETHPYLTGFLLGSLPPTFLMIVLKYLNGLVWIKDSEFLSPTLRTVGVLMIVTSGLWAVSQSNLKRLIGYLVIEISGFSLLCISLQSSLGTQLFYLSLIPHVLAIGCFSFALTVLQKNGIEPDLENVHGLIRQFPVVFVVLIISILSIIGLPLFASFSINFVLLEQLSANPVILVWAVIGYFLMAIAMFRLLISLIGNTGVSWKLNEKVGEIIFLVLGALLLVLMGVLPSHLLGGIWSLLAKFLTLA